MNALRLACLFPGQGSQHIGMLAPWRGHRLVEETMAEASDALHLDLWGLTQYGPLAELNSTVNTQPVMVATSVALFRAWQAVCGLTPEWAAGHSVGELAALASAGVLKLSDAMRLVRVRAQAMACAVTGAGMAAVLGLEEATVERLCAQCAQGEVLEPVNYNAPGQLVVAGHLGAIERLKPRAKAEGAKMVLVLPVSGPFHSSLMSPAADAVAEALEGVTLHAPAFPVLQNATMQPATPESTGTALVTHLVSPVRWADTVRRFAAEGITHAVEVGCGEVLTNLCRRIDPSIKALPLYSPEAMERAAQALQEAR